MRGFPDNFYPEHEYLVFRQIVNNLGFTADSLIGRQRVDVEYLVRTSHIMLPTSLHMPSYKSDPRFTWRNDAIVEKRGSTNPQTYAWDVLYPRHNMHLGVAIEQVQSQITNMRALTGEEASLYAIAGSFEDYIFIELGEGFGAAEGALRIFVNDYGLTAAEYLHYIALYEEMVYDVYLETTPSETENIQLMIEEVFKRQQWITAEGVVTWGADPDTLSAYDTAFLIEHYFKNGYIFKYSLIVDNHRGDNSFLGNFLHETRTGHCALYATAMTLMLRELGIPARYVTGFVAGGNSTARYGERYQHRILERDLHAWVEVYFSGIGWLPFDPTPPITDYHFLEAETAERAPPPVTTPRVTTPPVTTPPVTAPPGTTTPQVTTPPRITEPGQTPPPFSMPPPHTESRAALTFAALMLAVAVLLAAGIAAAVVMFLKGITRAERRRLAKYADLNEGAAAREAYRFMLKLLKMEGLTALAGETPVKFAARVDEEFCMGVLNPVIGAILKLEFSREELNAAEYAALSRTVKSVYRQVVTEQRKLKRLARRIAALDIIK
jgi:transglutaminase-like putative cysteine protease